MILFAKRLKEKRKEMGFTQKQLGEMIDDDYTEFSYTYNQYGEMKQKNIINLDKVLDTLIDLANALQVELTYLLGVDSFVVAEGEPEVGINIAYNEIALIKELRMHIKLYERLLEDPKRTMDYIEKKLR